jgi:arsenate reductase-like glutaredoxin family protein
VTAPDFILANKQKFHRDEALALMAQAQHVLVAKGKNVLRLDAQSTEGDELAGVILGRSGTLRAPAIRVGKTFLVGFHADAYTEIFGT